MKELDTKQLSIVAGGKASSEVTTALTSIQSSLKDLGNSNNNKSNDLLLPMMMMMSLNKPQPTVVAAGAAVPSPVVNISTRVRRRC